MNVAAVCNTIRGETIEIVSLACVFTLFPANTSATQIEMIEWNK